MSDPKTFDGQQAYICKRAEENNMEIFPTSDTGDSMAKSMLDAASKENIGAILVKDKDRFIDEEKMRLSELRVPVVEIGGNS